MFDFVLKGGNASQLEKDIGSDLFPANEHYFGLVNVSLQCRINCSLPKDLVDCQEEAFVTAVTHGKETYDVEFHFKET